MDLSNMFSDLAHISNSGYREQLYTDPGILQGIEFLQNENKVKKQVEKNLNLNLISDSHGTGSTTVHLAGLLSNNGTMEEAEEEQVEGFTENMEGPTTKYYNNLKAQYKIVLDKFNSTVNAAKTTPGKGIIPLPPPAPPAVETPDQLAKRIAEDKQAREDLKNNLDTLSSQMANISAQLMSNVKDNTGSDFSSYNKMQKDIDNVQKRIIEIDEIMQKNKLKTIYDVDTSLAKEEETALLTKQRYYVYIIWFIILAIILYITISNIFNPESSFSILLISLVLLICIFLFFMYSNWNTEWYDLKIKLKNLDFGLPDIPAIDFNPLVSIKYTS
jgi:NADH:ubiquinone oxidoreductase subunit 3 (subunit A)